MTKNILITGGAGSLGTALVNILQILVGDESNKIRILDNNEHALATMKIPYPSLTRKLHGSITDKDRVRRAVNGVDIVIHAAAMKNLEITEFNTSELIKTNVIGTDNIISAAVEANVSKIMFISSDKAVEPTSIYGASKLIGEHTALNYNQTNYPISKVSVFRSGNFLNSNGNVLELWRNQFKNTLPLTITDIKCMRYFINIDMVAKAIINCILEMEGGEIFVPDDTIMKEIPIINLAKKFIDDNRLDINNIVFTGLRKGEKLSESLFNRDELFKRTHSDKLNCWIIK